MVSARTGGLAVALGIGCAVAAGAGVASADTTDGTSSGPSGSDSTNSSQTGPSSAKTEATKTEATKTDASTTGTTKEAKADKKADKKPAKTTRAPKKSKTDTDADTAAQTVTAERTGTRTSTRDTPKPDTTEATEPTVTVAAEPAPDSTASSPHNDSPGPADIPAVWTMAVAAASRELETAASRESATAMTEPNAVVQQQSTALATAAVEPPKVVAIEQHPPLEFLQYVPVLGPVAITPVVALIHQIPIAGDILHPLISYPVQLGLPAGAPRPRDVKVVSADGTRIYVHFMPASGLTQGVVAPTVLNGPGLGATGATNLDGTFLDPILADTVGMLSPGTLRRAGYNVVTWDPRGEWNSGGRLELNGADFEGQDMSAIIGWIAEQPEAQLDGPGDPRLGMVGVSYGGGIQLVTAAGDNRVDAIVPAITYNRLDSSLYKSGAFKSSWATPLTAVLTLGGSRVNPRILPATVYGDITGQLTPEDLALFLSRNPKIGDITVPTLLINGTADTLFSLAEADATAQTLMDNGVTTKVIWFCGGHGVCANNLFDLRDGVLIERRTIGWLDRYVKADPTVDTGPQFEWVDQRGQWYSSVKYPVEQGDPVDAALDGERTLALIPYLGGSGIPFVPYALAAGHAINVKTAAATETTYLVGAPKLTMTYTGIGTASHVYAQLVDNNTGMVLSALVTPIPVTLDGASHDISIDLEPVSYTLRPGQSVTLQLVSSAGLYETLQPSTGTLTVSSLQVSLPTADPAAVMQFNPLQPTVG